MEEIIKGKISLLSIGDPIIHEWNLLSKSYPTVAKVTDNYIHMNPPISFNESHDKFKDTKIHTKIHKKDMILVDGDLRAKYDKIIDKHECLFNKLRINDYIYSKFWDKELMFNKHKVLDIYKKLIVVDYYNELAFVNIDWQSDSNLELDYLIFYDSYFTKFCNIRY